MADPVNGGERAVGAAPMAHATGDVQAGIVRGLGIGFVAFLAFLPVDLFVRANLYPTTPVAFCLVARLTGATLLGAAWLVLRRRQLAPRMVVPFVAIMASLVVATLALLSVGFGGIESFYITSPAFFGIGLATSMPTDWRRGLAITLPSVATFTGTLLTGVALTPSLSGQLSSARSLTIYAEIGIFILALTGFSIAAGHVLWAARAELRDAKRLGRYLLKTQLGKGGMNEVWLAWDPQLKRDVALKLLHEQVLGSARRERFEREAQATSALSSPHTVRVFDFGANDEGTSWIAMEHLAGRDLDGLVVEAGPLDPRRVVHFAKQAALALSEAHQAGLVHRDIKPANLMALAGPEQPDFLKVLDFGIARRFDTAERGLTATGMLIGTPDFMAPEVLFGTAADPRSDVWSFGATLYVLLTAHVPFEGFARIDPPETPSTFLATPLPTELDALVLRCLAANPMLRPRDGAELVDVLAALPIAEWSVSDARSAWESARTIPLAAREPAGDGSTTRVSDLIHRVATTTS